MKKIYFLLLIFAMLISLCACESELEKNAREAEERAIETSKKAEEARQAVKEVKIAIDNYENSKYGK